MKKAISVINASRCSIALTARFSLGLCLAFVLSNLYGAEPLAEVDLSKGSLLYETEMDSPSELEGWSMEGPGEVEFREGWMHMRSPGEEMHHVYWCPERFPESFVAQWEAQNLETDAGLCIVFFAAMGTDGQSIFSGRLPERDGEFLQYVGNYDQTGEGAIRNYHISYYANAARNPDRGHANMRKNPGFHHVAQGPEGIPTESEKIHQITLVKDGAHVSMWVDERKIIDWTDTGEIGGEPYGAGYIGLRQMKWTHFRYRNFKVWKLKTEETVFEEAPADELIQMAGNAESEARRYQILKALSEREVLDPDLRRDLERLLPSIEKWAKGRELGAESPDGKAAENGYLCHFIDWQSDLDEQSYPPDIGKASPLYPIWAYYRARNLLWIPIQIGYIRRYPERREPYYSRAWELLKVADAAFPENRIIDMYLGEPLAWPAPFGDDPNAPDWANAQREGLEKLTDVIHWWIDERQIEDGQFGGGWGDDVEMWRWWTPLLLGFQDPKIVEAQRKLSESMLSHPRLAKGYTDIMSDVEHTAEDTGDTITPMLLLEPENEVWTGRAKRLVELANTLWMGHNERDMLQFKSVYFNVEEVDLTPQNSSDTVYHPRALHPALVYWLRSGDEEVGELITDWMDTWVAMTRSDERGKPAGIIPSAIHWPDGKPGGKDGPWYLPKLYKNPRDLYSWPSAMSQLTKTLLLTYHMTGKEKYLEPIRSLAKIRQHYLENPPKREPEPGSAAWCALSADMGFGIGMSGFLPETLAKYRLLTGDTSFDSLLEAGAPAYLKLRLGMGRGPLEEALEANAAAFRMNKPGYTSEMRWTDRVMTFNERWGNEGNGWDWPTPNVGALYSSVTGDPGQAGYFPMNAVRWLTQPRQFAALVTKSKSTQFEAELYHYGEEPRDMGAELYLLQEGRYTLELVSDEAGEILEEREIAVNGKQTQVEFQLPSRQLCHLRVAPSKYTANAIPAFPGAQGAGTKTPGGRGGKVYTVTRLDDYGEDEAPVPGTFRYAMEEIGPRIVVFGVSGNIHLDRPLIVDNPYLTVAGNTAPFPGVSIIGPTSIQADHVLLRHLRFRLDVDWLRERVQKGQRADFDSVNATRAEYVVFDHLSGSHSVDETISMTRVDRVTHSNSIMAFSLRSAFHGYGPSYREHNFGGIFGGYNGKEDRNATASSHHNVWAHHARRMPGLSSADDPDIMPIYIDVRNSVMYNWYNNAAGVEAPYESLNRHNLHLNFIGNYLKPGPDTPARNRYAGVTVRGPKTKLYLADNVHDDWPRLGQKEAWPSQRTLVAFRPGYNHPLAGHFLETPAEVPPVNTDPNPLLEEIADDAVGASLPARDSIDYQAIQDVIHGTGKQVYADLEENTAPPLPKLPEIHHVYNSNDDVFPAWWKWEQGLKEKADPNEILQDQNGYTLVEAYLYGMDLNNEASSRKNSYSFFDGQNITEGWANRERNETLYSSPQGVVVMASSTATGPEDRGCRFVLEDSDKHWQSGSGPIAEHPGVSDAEHSLIFGFPHPVAFERVVIKGDISSVRVQGLLGWPDHWIDLGETRVSKNTKRNGESLEIYLSQSRQKPFSAYRLIYSKTQNPIRVQHVSFQ